MNTLPIILAEVELLPPDWTTAMWVCVQLGAAIVLGGLLGYNRERAGQAAGLRTHSLVALGAALFTIVPMQIGAGPNDLAQVVKGIAAGVGFLGAGAILKQSSGGEIRGLTTAASIWLTAAVGLAAGAGWIWVAVLGTILSFLVLTVFRYVFPHHDAHVG